MGAWGPSNSPRQCQVPGGAAQPHAVVGTLVLLLLLLLLLGGTMRQLAHQGNKVPLQVALQVARKDTCLRMGQCCTIASCAADDPACGWACVPKDPAPPVPDQTFVAVRNLKPLLQMDL